MSLVLIIGGGASGMMAAIRAARCGHEVHLFEKNEKFGKKIYITGKGRCNLTNACDPSEFLSHVCTNPKFLYSSFYGFTNQDTISFFESCGMRTKTERGNRVFPVSDHASDVIRALKEQMDQSGVFLHLNTKVTRLLIEDGRVCGIVVQNGSGAAEEKSPIRGDAVIVATGGLSYPSTGSTGDGYRFALEAGHEVTDCTPSLVPMTVREADAALMQGLSLRNVEIRIRREKKILYQDFGEMMFTHFGVTGPLILTASTKIQKELEKGTLELLIDLKPAVTEEMLENRFMRELEGAPKKKMKNLLGSFYPSGMVPVILKRCRIPDETQACEIRKEQRKELVRVTKELTFTITGLRDFSEAVVTRGGVNVRQVNPATMESRLCRGLYFAGEILDVDALTGGFNLQIAWSTGYAAGGGISNEF